MRAFSLFLSFDGLEWVECVTKQEVFTEIVKTQGDLGEISDRMVSFSRTISILQTKDVNDLLFHAYDLSTISQKTEIYARIESSSIVVMSGYARLISVTDSTYNVAVYDKTKTSFDVSTLKLNEIEWDELTTFDFNQGSITTAWNNLANLSQVMPHDTLCDDVTEYTCGVQKSYKSWTGLVPLHEMFKIVINRLYPNYYYDKNWLSYAFRMYVALPMKQSIDAVRPDIVINQTGFYDTQPITPVKYSPSDRYYIDVIKGVDGIIDGFTFNYFEPTTYNNIPEIFTASVAKAVYTYTENQYRYSFNFDVPQLTLEPLYISQTYQFINAYAVFVIENDSGAVLLNLQTNTVSKNFVTGTSFVFNFNPINGITTSMFEQGKKYKISIRYVIDVRRYPNGAYGIPVAFRVRTDSSARLVLNEAYKFNDNTFNVKAFMPAKPATTFIRDVLKMFNARLVIENNEVIINYDRDKFTESYNVIDSWKEIKGNREINYESTRIKSVEIKYAQGADPTTKIEYASEGFGYKLLESESESNGKDISIKLDLIALANFTNVQNPKYDGIDFRGSKDELLRLCVMTMASKYKNKYNFGAIVNAPVFGVFNGQGLAVNGITSLLNLNFGENNNRNTFSLPRMDVPNIPGISKTYQYDSITMFSLFYERVVNSFNEKGSKKLKTKFILSPQEISNFSFNDKILLDGVLFEVISLTHKIDNGVTDAELLYLIPAPVTIPIVDKPVIKGTITLANYIDGNRNSENEFLLNAVNKQWLVIDGVTNYTAINDKQLVDANINY